ncbi:MAG: TraR/DksA family transcriptional regulator [Pseudobdellovibrionaceae bacterium]
MKTSSYQNKSSRNGVSSQELITECKTKLLRMKEDILNRVRAAKFEFDSIDRAGGDEMDLNVSQMQENSFLANQQRMREQLVEFEFALARIERGTFGICEETEEPIEVERLLALPWTRLSIEGAEIRESQKRRFAAP